MKKQTEDNNRNGLYLKSVGLILAAALIPLIALTFAQGTAVAADITVYKSPTCGCCGAWVDHLKQNGFSVDIHNRNDMHQVKADLGVPADLQSCHTARVEGYLIEGHVPADTIQRLLTEKPKIKGLAVPGMPMGSPGMEGPRSDPYDVVTFADDGKKTVYDRRNQ